MELTTNIKSFEQLTLDEFHDMIALRIAIFVIEQNCPYQDLDGKDKVSFHALLHVNQQLVATARILPPGISYNDVSIGRVVVDTSFRGKSIGHELMNVCMDFVEKQFGKVPVRISAQSHLVKFYNEHGFVSTGKEYLEDNIPHTEMLYSPNINL